MASSGRARIGGSTFAKLDATRCSTASIGFPAEAAVHCHAVRTMSVRTTTRTALVHKLGIGAEVAIFCTKGRPARSRALALRAGREDTLTCPTGEVVTLNAIRVILRRGRVKAGEEDNCRCYEGNKH